MDAEVLKSYEYLTPADRLVIDAMIISLYKKDVNIRHLVKEVMDSLEKDR